LGELRTFGASLPSYQNGIDPHMRRALIELLFNKALNAFDHKQYDSSWRCLDEAKRLTMFMMTEDELRVARAVIKARGAKVLNGWRMEAFENLMKKSKEAIAAEVLYRAADLIADSQESRFYSIRLAQRHTNAMSVILLLLCTLFLLLSLSAPDIWHPSALSDSEKNGYNPMILLGAFLVGGIGAVSAP
jgi:hypothetical protein